MKILTRVSLLGIFAVAATVQAQVSTKIKWACIGDKITVDGYPARMTPRVLMDTVVSYGSNGTTILKSGDTTYWNSTMLAQVFSFKPDIISIDLGANDSKPMNWGDSAHFVRDYEALIDTLETISSHPKIFLIYPTPVFKNEATPQSSGLLRGSVIQNSIIPKIRQVAIARSADTIDLNTPFLSKQTYFTDSINPTTAVNDTLAAHIYTGLLAQSIRVVCIGNSITQYVSATTNASTYPGGGQAVDAYPIKLNMLMGRNYVMWNGGVVGDWMQRTNFNSPPYQSYFKETKKLDTIFARQPQIITIMLGTNDARPQWWNTANYISAYESFIDTFTTNISPKPQIWMLKALPATMVNGAWPYPGPSSNTTNGISGDVIRDSVDPTISLIAAAKGVPFVDTYTPFVGATTLIPASDGVHPGKAGDDTIAHIIYRAMQAGTTAIYFQESKERAKNGEMINGQSVRYLKTGSGRDDGLTNERVNSLDGKTLNSNAPLAPGVYVIKPEDKVPANK